MILNGISRTAGIKLPFKICKYNISFPCYTVSNFPDFQGDFKMQTT